MFFECVEEQKLYLFNEILKFIYGTEFNAIELQWKQKAFNEYYSKKYK